MAPTDAQLPHAQAGDRLALRLGEGGAVFVKLTGYGEYQIAVPSGTKVRLENVPADMLHVACGRMEVATVVEGQDGPCFLLQGRQTVLTPLDLWKGKTAVQIITVAVVETPAFTVVAGGKVA